MSRKLFREQTRFGRKYHFYTGSCAEHVIVITKEGIFAAGRNDYFQLGIGTSTRKAISTLREIKTFKNRFRKIVAVGCGHYNSYFVFSNGEAYGSGDNDYSIFGDKKFDHHVPKNAEVPIKLKFPLPVFAVDCVAGNSHCLFLTNNGEVFGGGYNNDGELGIGHCDNTTPVMIPIPKSEKVVKIGAQWHSSYFLCSSGNLYGCGSNRDCQLSAENRYKDHVDVIQCFTSIGPIADFDCGCFHTMIFSKDRKLFGVGDNGRDGRVGFDPSKEENNFVGKIREIPFFSGKAVFGFGCVGHGSMVEISEGMFGFGEIVDGGIKRKTPKKLDLPNDMVQVSIGINYPFYLCKETRRISVISAQENIWGTPKDVYSSEKASETEQEKLRKLGTLEILPRDDKKFVEFCFKMLKCDACFDVRIDTRN